MSNPSRLSLIVAAALYLLVSEGFAQAPFVGEPAEASLLTYEKGRR